MKLFAGYLVAYLVIAALLGLTWQQTLIFPAHSAWIYAIFYSMFCKSSSANDPTLIIGAMILSMVIGGCITYGMTTRQHSLDDLQERPYSGHQ